jgi:Uncharacterised protein family (UPF0167)
VTLDLPRENAAQAILDGLRPEASRAREPAAPPAPLTLAEEGFPFPLFEGPRTDASLDPAGPCSICGKSADPRFNKACHACFRAGKAPLTMGTELGMVRPEDAAAGLTHGLPAGVVPRGAIGGEEEAGEEEGEPWVRFRVASDHLVELTRTPRYTTWQGASWLFCCHAPMIFTGSLDARALEALRGEGQTLEQVVSSLLDEALAEDFELTERLLRGSISMYAFRCPRCGRRRAHWDQD